MTINSIPQIKEKILGSVTYQKTRNKSIPNDQEPTQEENSSHQ